MAIITPVRPPTMKVMKNPDMNSMGNSHRTRPYQSVAIQAKNWTAVGIAISVLATEKKPATGVVSPTVNI